MSAAGVGAGAAGAGAARGAAGAATDFVFFTVAVVAETPGPAAALSGMPDA